MGKYKLLCMSFDGDYKIEDNIFDKDTRAFETIADAWGRADDMGSRWFFYPFHFVATDSLLTIADAPDGLPQFKGKRVKTVQAIFKAFSELPEMKNADADTYFLVLRGVQF